LGFGARLALGDLGHRGRLTGMHGVEFGVGRAFGLDLALLQYAFFLLAIVQGPGLGVFLGLVFPGQAFLELVLVGLSHGFVVELGFLPGLVDFFAPFLERGFGGGFGFGGRGRGPDAAGMGARGLRRQGRYRLGLDAAGIRAGFGLGLDFALGFVLARLHLRADRPLDLPRLAAGLELVGFLQILGGERVDLGHEGSLEGGPIEGLGLGRIHLAGLIRLGLALYFVGGTHGRALGLFRFGSGGFVPGNLCGRLTRLLLDLLEFFVFFRRCR